MSEHKITFEGTGIVSYTQTFTTKAGKEIVTLVLELPGNYPQLVPLKCFGRLGEDAKAIVPGSVVEVSGELGGKDWNGRVFGDSTARIVKVVSVPEKAPEKAGQDDEDALPPF